MSEGTLLEITRLAKLGDGVGAHGGRAVFVSGALPGETVRVVLQERDGVLRGEVLERLKDSPDRRPPACPLADRCGGCDWQHLAPSAQLRARVEVVQSALEHVGGLPREGYALLPPCEAPASLGYRRRAVFHLFKQDGHWHLGLFERHSHRGVPLSRCPALVPELETWLPALSEWLGPVAEGISAVHLLSVGGERALALELSGAVKPRLRGQVEQLVRKTGARGAVVVPPSGHVELVGKPVLRGSAPLRPEVPLFYRPDGFCQANGAGNEALVSSGLELLRPDAGMDALELYSGHGNFSFALAARVRALTAVESSPLGVELAQRAAREGRVANLTTIQGDALKVARGLAGEGRRFPLLLVDPPRSGAPGLAQAARELGVERLVYVACDPVSLARDARELAASGFRAEALQVVDMFPQTHHVEAVMAFARTGGGR